MSRQIKQLKTDGLVVSGLEVPGRRGQILRLTQKDKQALERAAVSATETLTAHLTDWGDDDINAFAELLARFTRRTDPHQ